MKFHFNKVDNLAGVVVENTKGPGIVKVRTRAKITSDEPEFYDYSDEISNLFLSRAKQFVNNVYQFLVLIHEDLSADLYVNDFPVIVEMVAKRNTSLGELVTESDVADIRKMKFPKISILKTDKIIYCFKVGWRFGLFFDLNQRSDQLVGGKNVKGEELDLNEIETSLGDLYRYLSFYHVYKVLESKTQFSNMLKDGWFPFIEIIGKEYRELSRAYQGEFEVEARVKKIVNSFTAKRIKTLTDKWWNNQTFAEKKRLIEPGINAFLQDNEEGYVNCIKTLSSEIEGVMRSLYYLETGKGDFVKSPDLISHIINKAKNKTGSKNSLFLPEPFLKYLEDVVFSEFSIEKKEVPLSRHSSGHGVANPEQYTKERALQFILVLDQIFFYC